MILAELRDYLYAAPVSLAAGIVIGLWIGARFDIRKKKDA